MKMENNLMKHKKKVQIAQNSTKQNIVLYIKFVLFRRNQKQSFNDFE